MKCQNFEYITEVVEDNTDDKVDISVIHSKIHNSGWVIILILLSCYDNYDHFIFRLRAALFPNCPPYLHFITSHEEYEEDPQPFLAVKLSVRVARDTSQSVLDCFTRLGLTHQPGDLATNQIEDSSLVGNALGKKCVEKVLKSY